MNLLKLKGNGALSEIDFNMEKSITSYRVVSDPSGSPSEPSCSYRSVTSQSEPYSPEKLSEIQKTILSRTLSRSGRDQQRFASDPETGILYRLTTGAVPIMPNGKIVLVSSSRTDGFILPKGGWEMDETVEVGAHRETFEEAGVLGTLGPKLTDVEYETRKGKKRRLELESLIKLKHGQLMRSESSTSSSFISEDEVTDDTAISVSNPSCAIVPNVDHSHSSKPLQNALDSSREIKVMVNDEPQGDDTNNIADETNPSPSFAEIGRRSCTHARMCMFIMYVTEVKDQWPECERTRKLMDIDEAIEATANRPEFQTVLLEVKRNRYHLNVPPSSEIVNATQLMD